MKYVEVEFSDATNARLVYGQYEFSDEISWDDIPFIDRICVDFENFIDKGVNPEWSEEEKNAYYDSCEWFWWPIDAEDYYEGEEQCQ